MKIYGKLLYDLKEKGQRSKKITLHIESLNDENHLNEVLIESILSPLRNEFCIKRMLNVGKDKKRIELIPNSANT